MRFNNKVAIVTGAGQGIGYEICNRLAQEGAYVLLNDVDEVLAREAVQKISKKADGRCIALAGDSGDIGFIQNMVKTAVAEFGSLDIAIANAGITLFGDFFTYPPESFFNVMRVNLGVVFSWLRRQPTK